MKELDFDELDKAVNSLMVDGNYEDDASKQGEEAVPAFDSSPFGGAAPVVGAVPVAMPAQTVDVASSPVVPAQSQELSTGAPRPLAMRRAGRFMDVVHSSSDMTATRTASTTMPSRTGLTMTPPAPVTPPQPTVEDVAPAEEPSGSDAVWPDPIAIDQTPVVDVESNDQDVYADDQSEPEVAEEVATNELTYSPFVPGAVVEKRPLGSLSSEIAAELSQDTADATPVEQAVEPEVSITPEDAQDGAVQEDHDNGDQLPATAEERLPAELQDDLMAIEADEVEADATPAVSAPEAPVETPVSSGPISIAQQYAEEVPAQTQQQGDIYDTKDYHQPIAQTHKKKLGWLWAVGALLLVVLGVAGGAALYLFVL